MKAATSKPNATQSASQTANSSAYLRTKVMTASPAELRLMLFDGAIRFAEQARQGLIDKNFESCYAGVTRCQNILLELINGLRPEQEPSLCEKLAALYTYMYMRLVKTSSERDVKLIEEVLTLLHYERDTWVMLLDQLAQENRAASQGMKELPGGKSIGGSVSVRG